MNAKLLRWPGHSHVVVQRGHSGLRSHHSSTHGSKEHHNPTLKTSIHTNKDQTIITLLSPSSC